MTEAAADQVFFALSDRTRRAMLDVLKSEPGSSVGQVCQRFDMSRIAAMKHLRVLEEAQLLTSRREGRSRRLFLNVIPLQRIYDRWTTEWSAHWARGLVALQGHLEANVAGTRPSNRKKRRKP